MYTQEVLEATLASEGWRAIKAIADSLGVPKPEGGWEEAIPLILAAQGEESASQGEDEVDYLYPTEYYEKSGIVCCPDCGAPPQTGLSGQPVCPVSSANCPTLAALEN